MSEEKGIQHTIGIISNTKGNMVYISYIMLLVSLVSLSTIYVLSSVLSTTTKFQEPLSKSYEMNYLENLAVTQFTLQLSEYVDQIPLTEESNTEDYWLMIKDIYTSTTNKGNLLYVSPSIKIHSVVTDDEKTLIEFLDLVSDGYYTEEISISPLEEDLTNDGTIVNFQDEDTVYLEPIQLKTKFSNGSVTRESMYLISNVFLLFRHQNETSINMSVNTSEAKVRRVSHLEYSSL